MISIGCVVLAAGNSTRFGKNKLLAGIEGKSMIERALEAVPAEKLSFVTVVTQYDSVAELAGAFGFERVVNEHPELGISCSVRLGTEALADRCEGILYMVADQPWLKRGSVARMTDAFREHPDCIIAASSGGKRGNPCIFPRACFGELRSLSGDTGGRAVIERHRDKLLMFELPEEELSDVDAPEDISSQE